MLLAERLKTPFSYRTRIFSSRCPKWKISGITTNCQSHIIPYCSHHFMHKAVSRRNSTAELDTVLGKTWSLVCITACKQFFCWSSFFFINFGFSYYPNIVKKESKSKLIKQFYFALFYRKLLRLRKQKKLMHRPARYELRENSFRYPKYHNPL